jgi:hypothetical protein
VPLRFCSPSRAEATMISFCLAAISVCARAESVK